MIGPRSPARCGAAAVLLSLTFIAGPAAAAAQEPARAPAEQESVRSVWNVLLHTVGGAVVGGWVGWMGSQVAVSDWDRSENSELLDRRAGWVAGGAVAGMIASQLIGSTSAPGATDLTPSRAPDRTVITREEIENSGANTAYQLIRSLRNEWLRAERGTHEWSESLGAPRIWVYLNSTRLGGLNALQDISTFDLQRVEWIAQSQAAIRYGADHTHGVIQLWTVENRSP